MSPTYPLDKPAALCESNHALVRNPDTLRHVQALKPRAILGDGVDGSLGDLLVFGEVERIEVAVVGHEGDQARIRQVFAVGEGQTLDAGARSKGHDAAIVDHGSERGQVQAPNKVAVVEERVLDAECSADKGESIPIGAQWAMPEDIDGIASPPLAGQHNV